ncbi:MAG TPA: copper resistance system multicopper oxidase [Pyrinomonadaceae bacterium]|nr:copper resistance system multicopper oxidase [Pyrinomonadaceae bacterium]
MTGQLFSRREALKGIGALGVLAALERLTPTYARLDLNTAAQQLPALSGNTLDLTIAETSFRVGNRTATARTINGTLPGPIIRLREGQDVTLRVTNHLKDTSSIHWHGVLVPPDMDGVPGVSFAGIKPGTTFVYNFRIKQYGTYWYHSHSPGQLQAGVYAPLIFDPLEADPIKYDREYVVVLSDWTFSSEQTLISKLKKQAGYFNFQQRTMDEFFSDLSKYGSSPTWENYLMWARMRMDPTDFADVTGHAYTYLMNGLSPETNWTGLFRPGERVRLRFIDSGSMTFFDVRIPGLKMTVVQADGQNVQPIEVDEFRMGPAETYDVIVEPKDERAYTIFAEALDRSGYARGTLAPRAEMSAEIPKRRLRPLRTMEDMGMSMEGMSASSMKLEMDKNMKAGGMMSGMDDGMDMNKAGMKPSGGEPKMPGMQGGAKKPDMPSMKDMQKKPEQPAMPGMPGMPSQPKPQEMKNMPGMNDTSEIPGSKPVKHGPDNHGIGNQSTPEFTRSRLDDPGVGLGGEGRRVLVYTDLRALHPYPDRRQPERELELHATGHMERFIWSFEGKKFSQEPDPIHFRYGERLRWTFVNDTMMEHTFHLHGMFMELENGTGDYLPRKHTVLVKPAERVSVAITPIERGPFAFHCHLNLHMEAGMFRVVLVSDNLPEVRS